MHARRAAGDLRPGPAARRATYGLALLVWGSGTALALLAWWLRPQGEFGPVMHPAEPAVRTLHGLLAVPALFGLGWLGASHAGRAWRSGRPRAHGPLLLAALLLLAASGFALYHLADDRWCAATGVGHALLGLLALGIAVAHWRRPRAAQPGRT